MLVETRTQLNLLEAKSHNFCLSDYKLLAESFLAYAAALGAEYKGLTSAESFRELLTDPIMKGIRKSQIREVIEDKNLVPSEYPRVLSSLVRTESQDVQRHLRIFSRMPIQDWEIKRAQRIQGSKAV